MASDLACKLLWSFTSLSIIDPIQLRELKNDKTPYIYVPMHGGRKYGVSI